MITSNFRNLFLRTYKCIDVTCMGIYKECEPLKKIWGTLHLNHDLKMLNVSRQHHPIIAATATRSSQCCCLGDVYLSDMALGLWWWMRYLLTQVKLPHTHQSVCALVMNDVRGGTQWGCIKLSHPLVARHSLPSSCQTALNQPWVVACNKAWAVYNVLNVMRCLLFYYPARSVIYIPVCESTHPDCILWCGSRTHTYKPVAAPETQVLSGLHCKHI